ncbi:hypothetical protein HYC85_031422 [Camellia sinensis]|uniref:Myosin motor domain-containing protein n=1 Tax=Camellia sinensis TaxID=4442 RepID=A0A7J7FQS1_CAMSI|nr:hypothetical protein HYC85_031422 [Camellia sinensis]
MKIKLDRAELTQTFGPSLIILFTKDPGGPNPNRYGPNKTNAREGKENWSEKRKENFVGLDLDFTVWHYWKDQSVCSLIWVLIELSSVLKESEAKASDPVDVIRNVSFAVGSLVWVEDPDDAWLDGEVVEVNGEEIKVLCTSGKTVIVKASSAYPKDAEAPPCGVDDMTRLAYLHEPGVLYNLKSRYDINEIYTYTGNILIAVNPFRRLPHLYDNHMMAQYKGAAFGELSPHPFAVADAAYSGESGAGKTESTKMLMRYLAYMGGRVAAEGRTVEQKVLESNPVLEAFGNAKTVRNNNSSRFGKFVELQFDQRGRISGAAIRTYLLERSRVCQVSDPERNYHCFYMLCAAPPEDVERYKLGNPRTFHYLNQSNCYDLDGIDDSKEYIATKRAMDVVGMSSEEQDGIFRVVAAILHLGNIDFAKGKEMDSSMPKDEKSWFHLRTAAELFMCDPKALEDSLCKRVIVTRDETITKWLDPEAAAVSRDALAKVVYSRLVDKINNSIGQDPTSKFLIGVLDIYGFESFKTNRCLTALSNFAINLTNEKLQQHFNQHVFKMEQEEYTKEEIDWSYIEFVDNQDILDLIEKVTYQTEFFLDKNKDYVIAEHQALLSASKCSFVSGLFPLSSEESSKQSKFSSIGSRFKQQLQQLLETLSSTEPRYIRCVKPNNLLKPAIFENSNVLQQLRCGGVMEAIRISCAGYPTRKPFLEFVDRFGMLAPEVLDGSTDEFDACKRLLEKVGLQGYQIGKTKVFLRAGQMAELDARRIEVLGRSASIIQRKIRSYMARKTFVLVRRSAIQIQSVCRGQLAREVYENIRREASCLRIQRDFRMHLARKAYKELCSSAVSIQAGMRGMVARDELRFRRQTKAAIIVQSHCRKYLACLHYTKLKKAAITTQCAWRGKVARRELKKLKMAARETGALQAAKNKLEKQVEELTWRLQLEKRMRADVEEAKTQENAKLQSAMQEMQLQFKETKEMLMKEREAAKKAVEQIPIIQEVAVIDHAVVDKLAAENEKLKALVSSLEKKIDETEKKFEETNKVSEERLKQALEAESKIIQLKTSMQRLEEKISDMESENQILRQQSLFNAPVKFVSEHPSTPVTKNLENGNHVNEENKSNELQTVTPTKKFGTESDSKFRRSLIERQHENVDALINCIMKEVGFSQGSPVAAFTIYKCLLQWKSFEAERTSVFDRLIQTIGSAIEGFRSSPSSANLAPAHDTVRQVEAKYPALLFKQQLTAYVEKIYGIIRDNLKKELASLLSLCIQVPPILVQKIFSQTFSYINVQLFNSLLLRRECCTFSNGEYVKAGLAELELWCCQAKEEYAGSSWDELKHIRQSVGFLVISSMRVLMTEDSNDAGSSSFLLDDNSGSKGLLERTKFQLALYESRK